MKLKIVKLFIVLFLIILICINLISYIFRAKEKEGYKYTYIWETIEKLNNNELEITKVDDIGIIETLDILFYDKSMWNKLPLSDSFIKKYKNPQGIIKKYYKYESIGTGFSNEYDKDNVIFIGCIERSGILYFITGKNITTYYTFEYVLDDNNKLDDLILLKEVDIDSMTSETYDIREYS